MTSRYVAMTTLLASATEGLRGPFGGTLSSGLNAAGVDADDCAQSMLCAYGDEPSSARRSPFALIASRLRRPRNQRGSSEPSAERSGNANSTARRPEGLLSQISNRWFRREMPLGGSRLEEALPETSHAQRSLPPVPLAQRSLPPVPLAQRPLPPLPAGQRPRLALPVEGQQQTGPPGAGGAAPPIDDIYETVEFQPVGFHLPRNLQNRRSSQPIPVPGAETSARDNYYEPINGDVRESPVYDLPYSTIPRARRNNGSGQGSPTSTGSQTSVIRQWHSIATDQNRRNNNFDQIAHLAAQAARENPTDGAQQQNNSGALAALRRVGLRRTGRSRVMSLNTLAQNQTTQEATGRPVGENTYAVDPIAARSRLLRGSTDTMLEEPLYQSIDSLLRTQPGRRGSARTTLNSSGHYESIHSLATNRRSGRLSSGVTSGSLDGQNVGLAVSTRRPGGLTRRPASEQGLNVLAHNRRANALLDGKRRIKSEIGNNGLYTLRKTLRSEAQNSSRSLSTGNSLKSWNSHPGNSGRSKSSEAL